MMPPLSVPARPVQILRRIARLLRLRLLLAICMRTGIVTGLISGVGYRLLSPNLRHFPATYGVSKYGLGDAAYIAWLVLSPIFFIPCNLLIDLGLCVAIACRIRTIHVFELLQNDNQWDVPMVCLIILVGFFEFITILCVGLLRALGACFAVTEAYYLAGGSGSQPRRAVCGLIFGSGHDWWTFSPLPEDFTSRKWYRRMWRPWLPTVPPPTPQLQECRPKVTPLLSVLFGSKTFQARRGERLWFVTLRGLAAVGCLGAVIAYSTNVLFLQPSGENRGPGIQMQLLPSLPTEDNMPAPVWGVIVGINTRYIPLTPGATLGDMISVIPEVPSDSADIPGCSSTTFTSAQEVLSMFQFVSYQCPTLWINEIRLYTPQIRVSADYAASNLSRSYFSPEGSIKIWPSFTSDVTQVLESTQPVSLVVGNNFVASATGTLRCSSTSPTRAMFGFNSKQQTYITGQLTVLGIDPLAPAPAPAPAPTGTVATMRIFKELQSTDWELYSDTRHHTILEGLSAIGGLSVFLNSTFAILFGGSLMLVLFDIKPLSVFGLFHFFSRNALSGRFAADFPRLRDEGGQPGDTDSGLIAFMREHMLDLAILPPKSSPADTTACGVHAGGPIAAPVRE